MDPSHGMERLLAIMAALRDPETGCPWDRVQTFETIVPYTIEEAHEVADAIERGDMADLRDELGDLLLQSVYHARMAEEAGAFRFEDVANAISDKMIRRHPHVFGDEAERAAGARGDFWEKAKEAERASKDAKPASALDGVIAGLPSLVRALKLQKRAARVGFDWPDHRPVIDKLHEEIAELEAELAAEPRSSERIADEIGDLLFTLVNLARKLDVDPDGALRRTNGKFIRRFQAIEKALAEAGRDPASTPLDEMEALWVKAKTEAKPDS